MIRMKINFWKEKKCSNLIKISQNSKKEVDDYIKNGVNKTYAVISSNGIYNIGDILENAETQDEKQLLLNEHFCTQISYNEDCIDYFAYKDNQNVKTIIDKKRIIMRKNIEITGIVADEIDFEKFKILLEAAGISKANIRINNHYDDWLESLPKEEILGLNSECLDWIRHWGNGGGDESSQILITDAIESFNSDDPVGLADAIYNSVVNYTKSEFDAVGLTIELIDNCLEECIAAFYEQIKNNEEDNS